MRSNGSIHRFRWRSYFDARYSLFLGKANAETKKDYDLKINKALIAFKNANQKQRSNKYSEYGTLRKNHSYLENLGTPGNFLNCFAGTWLTFHTQTLSHLGTSAHLLRNLQNFI